jgi:dTDP-4-amino-4,6-dideoxygalactose transaminase
MTSGHAAAVARHPDRQMNETQRNGAIPRQAVLGWATFQGRRQAELPSVADSPHVVYTTSGRAAIALALRVLDFKAGERVLVPTYHCPTMISPVVRLGGKPVFFPVTASGAPAVDYLEHQDLHGVRAMLVAHYFGLAQPMARVRAFCDARGIALIEDCAHAFFGTSEGRPIGSWGDLAIASLTKFFPVPEGGCLVSTTHSLAGIDLKPRGMVAEMKALIDALELGARYHRFPGLNALLGAIFGLKELARGRHWTPADAQDCDPAMAPSVDDISDALLASRLTRSSRLIAQFAHRSRIVALRRRNYELLAQLLTDVPGAAPFQALLPASAAPYVFPLRVDHPAERYPALRAAKVPLFRWDRLWPEMPTIAGDHGPSWAVEMFQLACHQDLSETEVRAVAATVRRVFSELR